MMLQPQRKGGMVMTMTTQIASGLDFDTVRESLRDMESADAERDFYTRQMDALADDPARYDYGYDEQYEAYLEEQEEQDYIYLRDECVAAIEAALGQFDPEDAPVSDSDVNAVISHLRQTGHLENVHHSSLDDTIRPVLVRITSAPTHEDYVHVFEALFLEDYVTI